MANSDQTPEQLDWLAFRFVSGEMNRQQEASFCRRMADEQVVREAVAEAVQLTQAIAFAEQLEPIADQVVLSPVSSAHVQRSSWMRLKGWIAVGGVCCLALVILFQYFSTMGEHWGSRSLIDGNGVEEMLAITWSEIRSEIFSEIGSEEVAFEDHSPDIQLFQLLLEEDAISTPTWMLAAVAAPLDEATTNNQGNGHQSNGHQSNGELPN